MRAVAYVLVLAAAALAGNYAAKHTEMRAKQLRLLEQLCDAIAAELTFLLPTIPDLLTSLSQRQDFASLGFLQAAARNCADYPRSWQDALLNDVDLDADEREILQTLGESLGRTELSRQLSAISLCSGRLSRLRAAAEAEQACKARLYRSMGVLMGIFLVIMLL